MAREDSLLKRCQAELLRERDAHADAVAGLTARLTFYVENQALLDSSAADLAKEREANARLSAKLKALAGGGGGAGGGTGGGGGAGGAQEVDGAGSGAVGRRGGAADLAAKDRRIKALEAQLKRVLEGGGGAAGLAKKRGSGGRGESLAALIEATRPSERVEQALAAEKERSAALEAEVREMW